MERDELEFLISQYSDDSLPAEQRAGVEAILASDAEARALLEQYRRLDGALAGAIAPLPSMDFAELRDSINDAIDQQQRLRIGHEQRSNAWTARLALVAVVSLMIGAVTVISLRHNGEPPVQGVADVTGPVVETTRDPAVVDVQIVQPNLAQLPGYLRYGDLRIDRPGKVSIAADVPLAGDDKKPN